MEKTHLIIVHFAVSMINFNCTLFFSALPPVDRIHRHLKNKAMKKSRKESHDE